MAGASSWSPLIHCYTMSAVETTELIVPYTRLCEVLGISPSHCQGDNGSYDQLCAMANLPNVFSSALCGGTFGAGMHQKLLEMSGLPVVSGGVSDRTTVLHQNQWRSGATWSPEGGWVSLHGTAISSSVRLCLTSDPNIVLRFVLEKGPVVPGHGNDVCRVLYNMLAPPNTSRD